MPQALQHRGHEKLGAEFASRLHRLGPQQQVRAIVMVRTAQSSVKRTTSRSLRERTAVVAAIRKSAEPVLSDIDQVLSRHDGRRLADHFDAFGSIPVETTVSGIHALADLALVKAILEDQPISSLHQPRSG